MVKKPVFTLYVAWNLLDHNQTISSWFSFIVLFWFFCGRYFVFPYLFFYTTCLFYFTQTEQGDFLSSSQYWHYSQFCQFSFMCIVQDGLATLYLPYSLSSFLSCGCLQVLYLYSSHCSDAWRALQKISCIVGVLLNYFSVFISGFKAS